MPPTLLAIKVKIKYNTQLKKLIFECDLWLCFYMSIDKTIFMADAFYFCTYPFLWWSLKTAVADVTQQFEEWYQTKDNGFNPDKVKAKRKF